MFNFNFFKSAPAESESAPENQWNANTVAMQQPSSPAAPSTNQQVVSEQPVSTKKIQESGRHVSIRLINALPF